MEFNIYNQVDSTTFERLKESAGPTAGVFKNKMFFSESGVHVFGKIAHVHAEFILNSGKRLIEACKMKAKPVKEESKLAVTPTVITTDYVSSHGKQPAGKGAWIFGLGSKKEDDWFQVNDTFANAKKQAIEKAKKAGIAKVYVMESVAAESVELDVVVESVGVRAVKARMLAEGREEVGFHVMTESAAITKASHWLVEKVASIDVEEPREADTVSTELIKNMIKKYREAVNKEQGIEDEEDPLPDGDTEYMDAFVVKDAPKVKGQDTRFVKEGLSDLGKGSKTQKFNNQIKWRAAATAAGAVVTTQGGSSLVARIRLKDGSKKTIGSWTGTQGQLTVGSYAAAAATGFNNTKNFAANILGTDPIVAGAVGVAGAAGNAIAHGIGRLAKKVTRESLEDAAAKHLDSM